MVESYTSFSADIHVRFRGNFAIPGSPQKSLIFGAVPLLVNLVQNSKPFRLYHTTAICYSLLSLRLDLGIILLLFKNNEFSIT